VPSLSTTLPAGVTITGGLVDTVSTAISATGTTLGTAAALTNTYSVITTCGASAGVTLPAAAAGAHYLVTNHGANTCNIYPDTVGHTINSLSAGTAITIATDTSAYFEAPSTSAYNSVP
jgi:hypothetical protein